MKNLLIVLFILLNQFVFAQNRQIYGKVTDDKGKNLPGVSVLLKGTTIGTMTDEEGTFNISFKDFSKSKLVFSYIGMKTKEIALSDTINIPLVIMMDESVLNDEEYDKYYYKITNNVSFFKTGITYQKFNFDQFVEFSEQDLQKFNLLNYSMIGGFNYYFQNYFGSFKYESVGKNFVQDSIKSSVVLGRSVFSVGYGFTGRRSFLIFTPYIALQKNKFVYTRGYENQKTSLTNYLQNKYINLRIIQYAASAGVNLDIKVVNIKDHCEIYPIYLSLGAGYALPLSKYPIIKSPNHKLSTNKRIKSDCFTLSAGINFTVFWL